MDLTFGQALGYWVMGIGVGLLTVALVDGIIRCIKSKRIGRK